MNIISSSHTNITISTAEESGSFILSPGVLNRKEFGKEAHPDIGVENKAIRITSDEDIQVLVYRAMSTIHDDVYMVSNQLRANTTYFTTAYGDSVGCGSVRHEEFYLVTSFYDDTALSIVQQDGTTFELELPAFGTFTQKTTDKNNHLASGTEITSNKPINVVSGDLCAFNNANGAPSTGVGTYASSIPAVASLGQQYIVPRIINEDADPPGFSVSVVATENDTTVESDGDVQTLDQGKTTQFEYPFIDRSILVTCSKPCLVTQYAKAIAYRSGLFMLNILPASEFSTSAYFTSLDIYAVSFVNLVVTGESIVDSLYMNGESLENLSWSPANGYTTAELLIPYGAYELQSRDGRPFAIYIYFHLRNNGGGAGYTMLPMESSDVPTSPTPTSTTTSPPANNTFPQHTTRVNGTAYTEDGQAMTPACALVRQQIANTM